MGGFIGDAKMEREKKKSVMDVHKTSLCLHIKFLNPFLFSSKKKKTGGGAGAERRGMIHWVSLIFVRELYSLW